MHTKEEFKKELMHLYEQGQFVLAHEAVRNQKNSDSKHDNKKVTGFEFSPLQKSYNNWYTIALPLIKLLVRDRYDDFVSFYKLIKRKPNYHNTHEYTISDYLNNDREKIKTGFLDFDEFNTFSIKFQNQLAILNACIENIDTILFDIENVLQYNMYKSELEAATDLLKNGFIRPAGALAGVVLERYLKELCVKHEINMKKKKPTMADYYESLRGAGIIDPILWRKIQNLADIRNYCDHAKEREPKKDEVGDLISGVEKIIAEVI